MGNSHCFTHWSVCSDFHGSQALPLTDGKTGPPLTGTFPQTDDRPDCALNNNHISTARRVDQTSADCTLNNSHISTARRVDQTSADCTLNNSHISTARRVDQTSADCTLNNSHISINRWQTRLELTLPLKKLAHADLAKKKKKKKKNFFFFLLPWIFVLF